MGLVIIVAFIILKILLNLVFMQKSLFSGVIKYFKSAQGNITFILNGIFELGVFFCQKYFTF